MMMEQVDAAFQVGDRVKLVLDKEHSPDNQLHGKTGIIAEIEFDDLRETTDNPHNLIYTVRLDSGTRHPLPEARPAETGRIEGGNN